MNRDEHQRLAIERGADERNDLDCAVAARAADMAALGKGFQQQNDLALGLSANANRYLGNSRSVTKLVDDVPDEIEGIPLPRGQPDARLVGEILAEFIMGLGVDHAMTPEAVVEIGGRASGR